MSTLLSYLLLLLLALFLLGQALSSGGLRDSLSVLRGRGTRISLLLVVAFLGGFLIWRSTSYMTEEREGWIVKGTEPGDTISMGFDTKGRFRSMSQPLGRVFDRNGFLLAGYVIRDGHLQRYYPAADVASHLVGYWTGPIRDGVGVEKGLVLFNDSLRDDRPHDVSLALDLRLQQGAMQILGGREGAIVVIDATNGEVLAAAAYPSFDPNRVWEDDAWRDYATDAVNRPLISRAVKDYYSPGSSIKPLVAAAALQLNTSLPENNNFSCTGEYTPGRGIKAITDHGAVHGRVDLPAAMRVSCNTYFSYLAYGLVGFDAMKRFLEAFGANKRTDWNTGIFLNEPGALRITPSRVDARDDIARSRIGIGQASVKLNPIHAAVLYAGIAQGGKFFAPSLELGRVPDTLRWALDAPVAEELANLLREPLKPGGTAAGIFGGMDSRGVTIYGKTGTADREPDGRSPSWFSSFGEKNDRRYAVIVVVENRKGSYAGSLNAPMANRMYEELNRFGYFNAKPVSTEKTAEGQSDEKEEKADTSTTSAKKGRSKSTTTKKEESR